MADSERSGRGSGGAVRRLLRRLNGGVHLDRLAAIEAKLGSSVRAQRDALAEQRRVLSQVQAEVSTRAAADAVRGLGRQVEDLQASLARQDKAITEALERARAFDEMAVDDRRFARRMEQIARRGGPVIVGPWMGEVGFELLYWVPFVRWVAARYGLEPGRLVVVSRGGVAAWYRGLAARYCDVFSYLTPAEFRASAEPAKKQRRVGAFDARVVEHVRRAEGLDDADLLHPGMMYRLFMPFWREAATMARVDAYTQHARLTADEDAGLPDLPSGFVAARFYFSGCFPDTPENREFVASTLEAIGRHAPVVVLNTPFAVDDHHDALGRGNVITLAPRMSPERNLAVQAAAIARARAFVGTYGGYSYLAPLLGVPALAFYSAPTFKPYHLHMAQRVFARLDAPPFVPLDSAALPLVRLALSGTLATTA